MDGWVAWPMRGQLGMCCSRSVPGDAGPGEQWLDPRETWDVRKRKVVRERPLIQFPHMSFLKAGPRSFHLLPRW